MTIQWQDLSSDDLRHELLQLEQRHAMTSQVFYDRFRAGDLGDAAEYVRWAGLCHMAISQGILSPKGELVP